MIDVLYLINPKNIRLEASTVCQLKCVSCPTSKGNIKKGIGSGFLRFNNFKRLVDANPWIQKIELSNFGEIFLNPDICKIIEYAYEKKIALHADNGANLNDMTNEIIESLVKYHFNSITCSIDGADNESYQKYRIRGNFNTVISNIKKINTYKEKYCSQYPQLLWQYIAFGHNEHLINTARKMAKDLNMNFYVKLSYEDMYDDKTFSPINNRELIKKETGLDVADRQEYYNKYGISYIRATCLQLWNEPQINFDGRLLGCCINFRNDFGNVFEDGLLHCLNGNKIRYARDMLMGKKPQREDIPCTYCKLYRIMKNDNRWITNNEIGIKSESF